MQFSPSHARLALPNVIIMYWLKHQSCTPRELGHPPSWRRWGWQRREGAGRDERPLPTTSRTPPQPSLQLGSHPPSSRGYPSLWGGSGVQGGKVSTLRWHHQGVAQTLTWRTRTLSSSLSPLLTALFFFFPGGQLKFYGYVI